MDTKTAVATGVGSDGGGRGVAAGATTSGKAWLDGLEANVYGFPLIMMDLTKDVSTKDFRGRGFLPYL